jgi:ribose transport system permease protein
MYLPVYAIVLAVYIFAGWQSASFFTWNNNVNLFGRVTPLILAGLAQTVVILTGGIDLSVGSMISVASVTAASLPYVDTPANLVLWVLVPPLVGLAMGAINGLLIAAWPFPPFIVTLASSSIYLGVALYILREPGGEVSLDATLVSSGKIYGIPIPLLLMLAAVAAAYLLLSRTRFGRSIYALGGNETLAIQSGIRPGRVKFFVYSLSGLFSGLAGAYLSAWMFAGDPLGGEPYVMNSIAVAVIGGSSLMGGRGGVPGVIGGAYIFYLINNILNLLGINPFYQYIAKGVILIAALAVSAPDLLRRLGLERRREQ